MDNEYTRNLEDLIKHKLLPIYSAYYKLIQKPEPKLIIPFIKPEKIAKLLQRF